MNLNTNTAPQQTATQPQVAVQKPAAVPQPMKQNKPPPPKDDAWSMASGLIDLDKGFGKQSLTKEAKPPQQQSSNLPNLSSYGNTKPDLTGFGGLGSVAAMSGMGGGMGAMGGVGMAQQKP